MTPERTVLIPRVVMKDSTRNRATTQPFSRPMKKLMITGSRKHTAMGRPFTASTAAMMPPRDAMLPTDRSNSLTLITSVVPREIITSREIWRVMLMKFVRVQNLSGRMRLNDATMTASARTVP